MGWESNDYDFMSDDMSNFNDGVGMDFGMEQTNNSMPTYGNLSDISWENLPQQNQFDMPGYDNLGNFTGFDGGMMSGLGMSNPSFAPMPQNSVGTQDFLGRLFSNPSLLTRGIGAIFEGQQNKKMAGRLRNTANEVLQRSDPFGSQRPFYQQELRNTVANPYSSAMVKSQVDQIARMQAAKDAAAGRRSNYTTTAPAMLAAQAGIAQDYMKNLMTAAGANMQPNTSTYGSMMGLADKYGANGGVSPLFSAIGSAVKDQENAALLEKLFNRG